MIFRTIIKHYLYDIGLDVMFDNMTSNFIIGDSFYDIYSKFVDKTVIIYVTEECAHERNLPSTIICGIVKEVTYDTIELVLIENKFAIEIIYIYQTDIYKLYV